MYRAIVLFLALMFSPVVATAQQPCTTDARQVVSELYRHMLERGADAGSTHWVRQLQNGQSVRDLVRQFAKSDEHMQRFWRQESGEEIPYLRAVGTMYRHILGRQTDTAGARYWATQAARRGIDPIVDQIVDSNEYDRLFGDWGVPGSGGLRYCGPGNQDVPGSGSAVNQRFRGMDRNNDGVISQYEWRGNRQAFENQDWNNDGVLSGSEVNAGTGRGQTVDDRINRRTLRFENLDRNGNSRIEPREWDGTVAAFNRLDANNDNFISRSEMVGGGLGEEPVVGTSGSMVRVEGRNAWTDAGINIRAGDTIFFSSEGTVRLSSSPNDIAGVGGALSGRRDIDAPLGNQTAGALIARIGNGAPFLVGNRRSVRAPIGGRLYLGVNDGDLGDNSGDFQVMVEVQP
jgi:hypothetical protein